jgi:hypothetical protein
MVPAILMATGNRDLTYIGVGRDFQGCRSKSLAAISMQGLDGNRWRGELAATSAGT